MIATLPVDSTTHKHPAQDSPNWIDWLVGVLLSLFIVLAVAGILFKYSPLSIGPIADAQMLIAAKICNLNHSECLDENDFSATTLPHTDNEKPSADFRHWRYQIAFDLPINDNSAQSLYLPLFSETLSISLNGKQIENMPHFSQSQSRRWARPEIYNLPQSLLHPTSNKLVINLSGYNRHWASLFPIYIGASHVLKKQFDQRYWLTRGAARISMVLMIVCIIGLGALWFVQRRNPMYLWLTIASFSCAMIMTAFSFDALGISLTSRMTMIVLFAAIFSLALIKFYAIYISVKLQRIVFLNLIIVILHMLLLPFLSNEMYARVGLLISALGFLTSFLIPATAWVYRKRISPTAFAMMFFAFLLVLACFIHDYSNVALKEHVRTSSALQFYPIFFMIIVVCLVGSQLLDSLKQSETLSATLRDQVDEKSRALKASFVELEETRRKQAISDERQRIMLDLHDGIGGQLHNTLAYMKNSDLNDLTLENALETTLQDLGLMVDSLGSTENVTTLLGMFRSRIDPLMARRNIKFVWKIGAEPKMLKSGPSQNLNLLRIVQEAVTNSIKHSHGNEITVYTDENTVYISDNGTGIKQDFFERGQHESSGGIGLISMRQRAKKIHAEFDLLSDAKGTKITLSWPNKRS